MGQFASTAFDGDPYIEIMRALPDKELTWWIQKGIWLAEGFTFVEHFGRTYKDIFTHQCKHCQGAGAVTCPHCHGYKVRQANRHDFRLPEQSGLARLTARADLQECEHCGGHCEWDTESEWQEKWNDWDSKLAYYDRTYAPLMDEWHEEVVNEGRMDEDTAPAEEPEHPASDQSQFASTSRELKKDEQRMKALTRRMGIHPYERTDMIPSKVLIPTKPLKDNLNALGYNSLDLPPELRPEAFPGVLLMGEESPLHKLDNEVRMEYLIMRNLDAAIKNKPKPSHFNPTAGTVPCPCCHSEAWCYDWKPNIGTLLRSEQPFWSRTLARMTPFFDRYSSSASSSNYSPWMATRGAPALQGASAASAGVQGGTIASNSSSSSSRSSDGASSSKIKSSKQQGWEDSLSGGGGGAGEATSSSSRSSSSHRAARRQRGGTAGRERGGSTSGKAEAPGLPPLLSPQQLARAEASVQGQPQQLPPLNEEQRKLAGCRGPNDAPDYGKLFSALMRAKPDAPSYLRDYGKQLLPPSLEAERRRSSSAAAAAAAATGYGPQDPLAPGSLAAMPTEELEAIAGGSSSLLPPDEQLRAAALATEAVNPTRAAARAIRDARQLGKAETPEEQAAMLEWARKRPSLAGKPEL